MWSAGVDWDDAMTTEIEIVFVMADLSGYTALTETHGNVHAAHVLERYLELAEAALAPGARILERVGDEMVIIAADAPSAIATAVRLREGIACEPLFPMVRIGIHAGAVVEDNGRYVGAGLNVTSRVMGQAAAGQIVCTDTVRRLAGGGPAVVYRDLGPVRLKNVREAVRLFDIEETAPPPSAVAVDPVCRMQIGPDAAVAEAIVDGQRYLFCSLECRDVFLGDRTGT